MTSQLETLLGRTTWSNPLLSRNLWNISTINFCTLKL